MRKTVLLSPTADDSDMVAAFAALRAGSVPLRPGFVAGLRGRLLVEITRIGQERTELTPDATTVMAGAPEADLRGLRKDEQRST